MLSNFHPVPTIGSQYRTLRGEIILVTDVMEDNGQLPDAVYYKMVPSTSNKEFEALEDDWNSMELVEVSEPIPEPDPQPIPGPSPSPELDPSPEPSPNPMPNPEPNSSDGLYSSDPYINELAKLLNAGPTQFNQSFFPTDKDLSDNNMVEKDVEEAFQKTLDEVTEIREEGKKKRAGFINEFLWACGGLDKALLRMCPTDWAKKAGMGGTILGTAVLATFSGGFAAYTVSKSPFLALVIGVIWGLVIFNLDRYLVNSMYSDGEPTISKQEFLSGLPRIIIAFFLGIVISIPIELKIFEGEINQYINAENISKIKKNEQGDKDISALEAELNSQRSILSEMQVKYQEYQDKYNDEVYKGGGGRIKGEGPVALALKADRDNYMNNILSPQREKVNQIDSDLRQLKKDRRTITVNNNKIEQGLSKRIEMLMKATSFYVNKLDESGNPIFTKDEQGKTTNVVIKEFNPLWLVRILISLMFIILEILPVVNKMMQTDGEYDKLVDLESDTREKLTRIKEFNNILITKTGHLAPFLSQIIGKRIVEDDNEGNNPYLKQDRKKENKDETDADNQEIYRKARKEAKEYIIARIENIFPKQYLNKSDQTVSNNKPSSSVNRPISTKDESDEVDTIS